MIYASKYKGFGINGSGNIAPANTSLIIRIIVIIPSRLRVIKHKIFINSDIDVIKSNARIIIITNKKNALKLTGREKRYGFGIRNAIIKISQLLISKFANRDASIYVYQNG